MFKDTQKLTDDSRNLLIAMTLVEAFISPCWLIRLFGQLIVVIDEGKLCHYTVNLRPSTVFTPVRITELMSGIASPNHHIRP